MAKQITQTVAKFTTSHDRMTLTFKFPNGEKLRINSSRYRSSLSTENQPGVRTFERTHLQAILKASDTFTEGENNGQRFERLKAVGEKTSNIAELAAAFTASQPVKLAA